jgi:fibronectin-binding autotransporter adhesin
MFAKSIRGRFAGWGFYLAVSAAVVFSSGQLPAQDSMNWEGVYGTADTVTFTENLISGSHAIATGAIDLRDSINSFTGTTIINPGTLQLNGENMLPYGAGKGNVVSASLSATLDLNNHNLNINGLNGSAGLIRNDSSSVRTLTLGNADTNDSYSGSIKGCIGLIKVGTGNQTLSGTNTYTGQTTVAAGTLKAGSNSALGNGSAGALEFSGATLDVNGSYLGGEIITVQGTGSGGLGAIVNYNTMGLGDPSKYPIMDLTKTLIGNTNLIDSGRWDIRTNPTATLSTGGNTFNLTKVGSNKISLSAVMVDSALANVNINQGILSLETSTNGLGDTSKTLTVASGGTLQMSMLGGTLNKKIQLNGGVIASLSGTGTINISSGTLDVGGGITGVIVSPYEAQDSYWRSSSTNSGLLGNPLAISKPLVLSGGIISGSGALTKSGTGTVFIQNPPILYGGNSTLDLGTLQIQPAGIYQDCYVAAGGTISGTSFVSAIDGSGLTSISGTPLIGNTVLGGTNLSIGAGCKLTIIAAPNGLLNSGQSLQSVMLVPEPSMLVLLMIAGLGLTIAARRGAYKR